MTICPDVIWEDVDLGKTRIDIVGRRGGEDGLGGTRSASARGQNYRIFLQFGARNQNFSSVLNKLENTESKESDIRNVSSLLWASEIQAPVEVPVVVVPGSKVHDCILLSIFLVPA